MNAANPFEIMQRVLELATTASEGLDFAHQKLLEGDIARAAGMLTDVIASFAQIQDALLMLDLDDASIEQSTEALEDGFRRYLDRHEARDFESLWEVSQTLLLPRYAAWHAALEKALRPRVAM